MIGDMEEQDNRNGFSLTHKLNSNSGFRFAVIVLVVATLAGVGSGYYLSKSQASSGVTLPLVNQPPKAASVDSKTFKDFAEGKLTKKPEPKNGQYSEGTHLLIRDGAVPVALTSSVVDLSIYENKKVKVYGETQKALHEGWLMDVGKVEEVK